MAWDPKYPFRELSEERQKKVCTWSQTISHGWNKTSRKQTTSSKHLEFQLGIAI